MCGLLAWKGARDTTAGQYIRSIYYSIYYSRSIYLTPYKGYYSRSIYLTPYKLYGGTIQVKVWLTGRCAWWWVIRATRSIYLTPYDLYGDTIQVTVWLTGRHAWWWVIRATRSIYLTPYDLYWGTIQVTGRHACGRSCHPVRWTWSACTYNGV